MASLHLSRRPSRRRGAAIAGSAVLALGVGVAACGGGGSSATGTDPATSPGAAASFVPAGVPLYAEVSTDLHGPQWTQLERLAKRFPIYPELVRRLRQPKTALELSVITPLLGDRAAIGLTAIPGGGKAGVAVTRNEPVVIAVDLARGKGPQVRSLILAKGDVTTLGTHDGVSYFGDRQMKGAVVGDVLVLAPTSGELFTALDAHQAGGDHTVAGASRITSALAKLPSDVFARAYVDVAGVLHASMARNPSAARALQALKVPADASLALSVSAEPHGLRLKGVGVDLPDQAATSFSPTLTGNVPADASAYVGFANLSGQARAAVAAVEAANPGAKTRIDDVLAKIPTVLGVSVDDLSALASGEGALVLRHGAGLPQLAAVLAEQDGARAARTLDTLRGRLGLLVAASGAKGPVPTFSKVDLGGGLSGWSARVPHLGKVRTAGLAPTYAVDGNHLLVGSTPGAVRAVRAPAHPLAKAPAFLAAAKQLPDQVTGLAWIDVPRALVDAQRLAAATGNRDPFASANGRKVRANLAAIRSVVAWSTVTGGQPAVEAFVRIR